MLPSHSHDTAAVNIYTGQNSLPIINQEAMFLLNSRAKFLPNSLILYVNFINIKTFYK